MFKNNNSLIILSLSNNEIKNIDILCECLKTNKSLQYLDLRNNQIENINKLNECLEFNKTLKLIFLTSNKINISDLNILKEKYKNIKIYF